MNLFCWGNWWRHRIGWLGDKISKERNDSSKEKRSRIGGTR